MRCSFSWWLSVAFKREAVDATEFFDVFQGFGGEGSLALEGVENDSFQQIAQSHIFQLSKALQNLEETFFHANAGLNAFNDD